MFTHALFACALLASAQQPADGKSDDGPPLVIREASKEGEEAIARIQTAPEIEVALYAAEPMVANLVALYVADDGAVYAVETFRSESGVTDMRNHMGWLDYELKNTTVEERVEMHRQVQVAADLQRRTLVVRVVGGQEDPETKRLGHGSTLSAQARPTKSVPLARRNHSLGGFSRAPAHAMLCSGWISKVETAS